MFSPSCRIQSYAPGKVPELHSGCTQGYPCMLSPVFKNHFLFRLYQNRPTTCGFECGLSPNRHGDLEPTLLEEAGWPLTVRPQGLKRSPLGLYWIVSFLVCMYDDIIHNECISEQMAASHIFETSCNRSYRCSHMLLLFISAPLHSVVSSGSRFVGADLLAD